MGWVFQGSPDQFDLDDYLSRYPQLIYWRTPRYAKEIALGDRAFIWRAGPDSGAVAIGTIVELPTPPAHVQHPEALSDDLWIAEKPDPAEPKTGVHLHEIRLTLTDGMIPRGSVKDDPALAATTLIRMPTGTVFKLSDAETNILERLWGIGTTAFPLPSDAHSEGARRLRAHYVRERSSRLRNDKLAAFRKEHSVLFCELCGEKEAYRYPPSYAERLFEVHHRAPLAKAVTPVKTTLNDLAVLCANCHRTVHSSIDVNENFLAIAAHFKDAGRHVATAQPPEREEPPAGGRGALGET